MSLDTLANVKARLGVTTSADDALLAQLQDSADQWVAGFCQRDFGGGTYTEYHPGRAAVLVLRNYPVQTVTSVRVDPAYGFGVETTVPPSAYVVHAEFGMVQSLTGPFAPWSFCVGPTPARVPPWEALPRAVQVVYSVATGAVPADVRAAYAELIGHWYRRVKTHAAAGFLDVTRQRFGDLTTTYLPGQDAGPPGEVLRLLAPYRVPLV
jgi:hypothetical protein